MHILFVDESGSPPEREKAAQQPFFVLGGIVIPEDIWAKMAGDLARLKAQFKIDGEIKWRYFAPDRGGKAHALSHLSGAEREALRTQLYQVIGRYKSVRLICVVTNTELAYQQAYITSGDDLYWYSYKQLTERFQYYLQDLERTVGQKLNGIVVCDHRGPKDDERLRELHHKLLSQQREEHDLLVRQHGRGALHRAVALERGHPVRRHGGRRCLSRLQGPGQTLRGTDQAGIPNLTQGQDRRLWLGEVSERLVVQSSTTAGKGRRVGVAPKPAGIGAVTA